MMKFCITQSGYVLDYNERKNNTLIQLTCETVRVRLTNVLEGFAKATRAPRAKSAREVHASRTCYSA